MSYEVTFPAGFNISDAVLTSPVPGLDGEFYFAIYGRVNNNQGTPTLTYLCRWAPGMAVVEFVTLEQYTHARGTLAVGPGGQHLWLWSFEQDKTLIVQIVPDWQPPAWMTAGAALEARIAAIEVRLTAIETALGNAGALDPKDREALDRLRRMLEL